MEYTCPRCKSDKTIDELKAAREYSNHYGCGTPELEVASSPFKFTCHNCGFKWGPAEGLLKEANDLEQAYWCSIEAILKLKKTEKPEWDFHDIDMKISQRKALAVSDLADLRLDHDRPRRVLSKGSLSDLMSSYVYVKDYYETRLNHINEGNKEKARLTYEHILKTIFPIKIKNWSARTQNNKTLKPKELKILFGKRASIATVWLGMSKEEKRAANHFDINDAHESISKAGKLKKIAQLVQNNISNSTL